MVPREWHKFTTCYTSACEEEIDGQTIPEGLAGTELQVPKAHKEHLRPTEQQEGESRVAERVAWHWGGESMAHGAVKKTVTAELHCAE